MIAGHETPTTGDIRIGGQIGAGLDRRCRRGTAMMFQSYALFPHRSVLDNVAFALKMRGADRKARAQTQARELLDQGRIWSSSPTGCRRSCPAASSNAWRWRAR